MSSPQTSQNLFCSAKIVRRARLVDVEALLEVAKKIPTAAQWSRANFEIYCAPGQPSETQAKALFVASVRLQQNISPHEQIIGFAAFSVIPQAGGGQCELENMAIAELWRRQGIGRQLLTAGMLWCRSWCPPSGHEASSSSCLLLEVRATNLSAVAFYQDAGFAITGRRPGYYTQPEDEAILMWKSLGAPY